MQVSALTMRSRAVKHPPVSSLDRARLLARSSANAWSAGNWRTAFVAARQAAQQLARSPQVKSVAAATQLLDHVMASLAYAATAPRDVWTHKALNSALPTGQTVQGVQELLRSAAAVLAGRP